MKTSARIQQILKDRQDYRQTLIHKQGETETKIARVEAEIKDLTAGKLVKE